MYLTLFSVVFACMILFNKEIGFVVPTFSGIKCPLHKGRCSGLYHYSFLVFHQIRLGVPGLHKQINLLCHDEILFSYLILMTM